MTIRTGASNLIAVASVSYALCDLLHEAGHAAATLLPIGVQALSISTVAVSTSRSSAIVAAAGVAANLVLGLTLLLSLPSNRNASWRYFWWLFGSLNLFNATGYFLYSGVLDSGDMAVALGAVAGPRVWRPLAVIGGLAAYAAAVRLSLVTLRRLVEAGVIPADQVDRYCMIPYWSGALLLMAGAALNPASPWLIVTSGAAVGFGAMVGLVVLPWLVRLQETAVAPGKSAQFGPWWQVAGAIAALLFMGVFGPGIPLSG